MDPITSLAQLQSAIAALPPVAPGKVRVFRGQTKDYDEIKPASYRVHLASRAIWRIYSRHLVAGSEKPRVDRMLVSEEMNIRELWLEALAQHYGSGSSYLDVTHSIESAAWFALHKGKMMSEPCPFPSEVPRWFSQARHTLNWLQYSLATGPGCIYAFDVDPWDPQKTTFPPPLTLVDLSNAPEYVRSPRMLAQIGCLVATGDETGHDLRCHRVEGTPLPVAWPMEGSTYVQRSVEEMFPSPAIDPWFRRFLSMPHVPEVDAASGELLLRRPLPVTLYRGETEPYNEMIKGTQWFLDPPLVLDTLQQVQVSAQASKDDYLQEVVMAGATPMLLEAPLMSAFPAAASPLWNHELLVGELGGTAPVYSAGQKEADEVSLDNIFVQLSALEQTWDRGAVEKSIGTMTRGVWLMHRGASFMAAEVTQNFPWTKLEVQPAVEFRLDPTKKRLVSKPVGSEIAWADLASQERLAKAIFVTLSVLRALTPEWKAGASPLWCVSTEPQDGSKPRNFFEVSLFDDVARLTRMKASGGAPDWFVFRDRHDDPFTHTDTSGMNPYTRIDTVANFADLAASDFQGAIKAVEDHQAKLESVQSKPGCV